MIRSCANSLRASCRSASGAFGGRKELAEYVSSRAYGGLSCTVTQDTRLEKQRRAPLGAVPAPQRNYSFATAEYNSAFGSLPEHDTEGLRRETLKYLDSFDAQRWFDDPIQTIINGEPCASAGMLVDTIDAAGRVNGKQLLADEATMERLIKTIQSLTDAASSPLSPQQQLEYATKIRAVEARLLAHDCASQLVGNQTLDFLKQDGLTEILESVQANQVERKLNDMLLAHETAGLLAVSRAPIFVACVSNFSNFLDLFRKTVRSLEAGVPCIVLARSNTAQHCYRWFQLLLALCKQQRFPLNMLAFASCDVGQQRRLFAAFPSSPVHFTGSREVPQTPYPKPINSKPQPPNLEPKTPLHNVARGSTCHRRHPRPYTLHPTPYTLNPKP
jgi:hypothetical protein